MNKLKSSAYLASLNINKMHFGLKAVTRLLSRLGNPHNSFKTITIAGTNGKGSTAAMISSILRSAGYRVGLYTSPHLVDVRERIVINGKKISLKDFNRAIERVREKIEQPVTYFEFLTAVAFVYFQNQKVDIAVLEVGLGGRLDATNVCKPLVSVITNIAFDHMEYLGSTLESIAGEKAGIIKHNGICVTGAGQKKVLDVLENVCRSRRAGLYRLHRDMKIKKQKDGLVTYEGMRREIRDLTVPLRGEHQLANAALALAAIELCAKKDFPADDTAIRAGLKNTCWEARLEILQHEPLFLLDGAHNPAGINVLCRALEKDFSYRRLILIFGALADKDYRRMLQKLVPLAQKIILTQLKTERTVPVNVIGKTVRKMGRVPVITGNVDQAMERALTMAGKQDLICATGSFYLAGEIKQAFRNC
ncbi:MAG: bifunctional folylpolyglutamate synthase/dihydrofolate synthase [Deltaproteobacteria bacterium]|nr:bifunctional folylpolyglutamate synthase/dihydrofolate synthase [Deltaproteobacteria bacterium]